MLPTCVCLHLLEGLMKVLLHHNTTTLDTWWWSRSQYPTSGWDWTSSAWRGSAFSRSSSRHWPEHTWRRDDDQLSHRSTALHPLHAASSVWCHADGRQELWQIWCCGAHTHMTKPTCKDFRIGHQTGKPKKNEDGFIFVGQFLSRRDHCWGVCGLSSMSAAQQRSAHWDLHRPLHTCTQQSTCSGEMLNMCPAGSSLYCTQNTKILGNSI